jgi:hypothetical protein
MGGHYMQSALMVYFKGGGEWGSDLQGKGGGDVYVYVRG